MQTIGDLLVSQRSVGAHRARSGAAECLNRVSQPLEVDGGACVAVPRPRGVLFVRFLRA